jgi:hypothetical protein
MALVYMDGFDHRNKNRYQSTGGTWDFSGTARPGSSWSYDFYATGGQTTAIVFPSVPASSTYHIGFAFQPTGTTNYPTISLLNDSAGSKLLDVAFATSNGKVQTILKKGSDGSTILTAGSLITTGSWAHISLTVSIAANGSGTLYIDENEQGSFTGIDLRNNGSKCGGIRLTGTGTGAHFYLDDLYVLDGSGSANSTWPGDMSVRWLWVTGAGSSTQWNVSPSGANWDAIDEPGTAGTDYVYSSTAGQTDLYACTDLPGSGIYGVAAVQISASALKSDAGAMNVALLSRANSITTEGPGIALTTTQSNYYLMRDEASSGVGWSAAHVNSMEIGVRVK